jgi:uncharacterized protein
LSAGPASKRTVMRHLSSFIRTYPGTDGQTILYSTLTGGTALVHEDLIRRLKNDSLTPDERQALEEAGFLVESADQERREVLELFDRLNENRRTLDVIAVMNLSCNMNCVYCYEGDRKTAGSHMSRETAESLVKFVSGRLEGNDKVRVVFYGGEPLLSLQRIREISEKMVTIAEKKGVEYDFGLVTNGTLLTSSVLDSLIPLGLKSLKVTIDGPRDIHESQRRAAGGGGSFYTIVRNVTDACERVTIELGGNYSRGNYRRFPELLDFLLSRGLDPRTLRAVKFDPIAEPEARHKIPSFGGGCKSINEPWVAEASVYLREEVLKRGFFTPPVGVVACMVCMEKEYVVNHDGSLYKCPGFLCHDDYCIGHLDKPETEDSHAYRPDLWKNERCLSCAYLPLCFGGCRYMEFVRTGKIGSVDCRHDYYEATLGTLIAQDIKYSRER